MVPSRPPLTVVVGNHVRQGVRDVRAVGAVVADGVRRAVRRRRPRGEPAGSEEGRDLSRQWRWSACYAPSTSLYLDQFGMARACCQNTGHPLGDVRLHTLRQIWDGVAAAELRAALASDDLSLGCDFCAWQRDEAGGSSFASYYDMHPAGWSGHPTWPRELEFSISNTCNLQCVMCNGDWSSSIRAQREHRPPLEDPYPERFYEELVEFIPHLRYAKFAGGEPFLARPSLRVMDLLAEHGRAPLTMGVITNGTTFNDRVERILDAVTPSISVSFDGGTAEVFEKVRVGASFDEVLANVDRFAAIVADHGTDMNLSHCLMVDNWSTFPEFLALAEGRGIDVSINTVRFPEAHSLYHLAPSALLEVVEELERRSAEVEDTVTGRRLEVWFEQLAALRARATAGSWPEALGISPEQRAASVVPVELTMRSGAEPS